MDTKRETSSGEDQQGFAQTLRADLEGKGFRDIVAQEITEIAGKPLTYYRYEYTWNDEGFDSVSHDYGYYWGDKRVFLHGDQSIVPLERVKHFIRWCEKTGVDPSERGVNNKFYQAEETEGRWYEQPEYLEEIRATEELLTANEAIVSVLRDLSHEHGPQILLTVLRKTINDPL